MLQMTEGMVGKSRPGDGGHAAVKGTQHAVDQPGDPLQAETPRQLDRFVDGGAVRHPLQVKDLVGAETQQPEDARLQLDQRLAAATRQGEVEAATAAQDAVDQFGGKAAVARVEAGGAAQGGVEEEIGVTALVDAQKDVEGELAGVDDFHGVSVNEKRGVSSTPPMLATKTV